MSENSSQNKSEKPTSQRLNKARKEGQVARSRELQSAVLVLLGGILLLSLSHSFGDFAGSLMELQFALHADDADFSKQMLTHLSEASVLAIKAFFPLLLVLWLASFASSLVPGGWLFSTKSIAFQGKKLDPIAGIKRLMSGQSLMELGKSIAKVSLLIGCIIWVLWRYWNTLISLSSMPMAIAIGEGVHIVAMAVLYLGLMLLIIAVADVPMQRFSLLKKLRMTKQEVKEENKNTEGRPEIKHRIRQLQMQMSRQRIDQRVPKADVILVNPTHYAVAIKYDPELAEAPYVIAKGADHLAQRIREVAQQNQKTILPMAELTRAIYYSTRVDQEVPAGLYKAVAHVLMYVMRMNAMKANGRENSLPLPKIDIPDTLKR
ncbi:flagellar biosynthesis protein FlhB [Gallaecimonas mangrovi]|uniref:flagellar biosynthesis protein FlhB n=1 Tax=Gallaecimonas mangrovi TaxID=2291597 RepID=UPI000E2018C6|nr:flagellar biosynthesis protein FlhB [Gallaecimonas mangrovi]